MPPRKKNIASYLKWSLETNERIDLPCYTSPITQKDFKKEIRMAAKKGHAKTIKILAPLTNNPNVKICGKTPIHLASVNGHTEIVKILASLTDNPNAQIDSAAVNG